MARGPCSDPPMRRLRVRLLTLLLAATAAPATAEATSRGQCLLRKAGPQCYLWTGKVTFVADGDTVYVDIDGDGSRTSFPVRITDMNAMEQTTYPSRASLRRGECHAVEATARLDQLLKAGRYKVRLLAQDPASRSVRRLRRAVAVRVNGRWIDVARTLITEGHAIWLPNSRESAWNRDYSILQGRAQWRPAQPLGPRLLRLRAQRGPADPAARQLGRRRQRRPRPQRRVGAHHEPRPGEPAPARR